MKNTSSVLNKAKKKGSSIVEYVGLTALLITATIAIAAVVQPPLADIGAAIAAEITELETEMVDGAFVE